MENKKGNFLSFLLGILVGKVGIPVLIHVFYWVIIIIIVTHKLFIHL